jgi:hypothetical protein
MNRETNEEIAETVETVENAEVVETGKEAKGDARGLLTTAPLEARAVNKKPTRTLPAATTGPESAKIATRVDETNGNGIATGVTVVTGAIGAAVEVIEGIVDEGILTTVPRVGTVNVATVVTFSKSVRVAGNARVEEEGIENNVGAIRPLARGSQPPISRMLCPSCHGNVV